MAHDIAMDDEPPTAVRYLTATLPLLVLPPLALWFTRDLLPWQRMWLTAIVTFACCKWMTWLGRNRRAVGVRDVIYLFAWPGLDADTFLARAPAVAVRANEPLAAAAKVFVGILLIITATRIAPRAPYFAGWIAMAGLILLLHFGLIALLYCFWRALGINAKPLMDHPARSDSVAEFWGRRWNTAFRDATHKFLFRPLTRRLGPKAAIWVGFFISGIVHELAITFPARGGYGLPTIYFTLQGAALLFERTKIGRAIRGRIWTWLIVAAPAPLLFPPAFIYRIILPFVEAVVPPLWTLPHALTLPRLIFIGGLLQWSVLVASALVPAQLDWKNRFTVLPRLLRQLFWTYGAYVVMAILFNGLVCVAAPDEIATTRLGQIVAGYILVFWGIRLPLQWVFDAEPFLTKPVLRYGDRLLTVIFSVLVGIFTIAAFRLID